MIKRICNVLGNKLFYVCILMVVLLFDTVLYIHDYTGPAMKLFLMWGLLIIGVDFFKDRRLWNTRCLKWLLLFCGLYLITAFINERSYLMSNLKTLSYMVLFSVLLYGHDKNKKMIEWKKEVRTIMVVFVWTTVLLSFICLMTYIFQINIEILTGDGYMHIGMADNRLWGLYNPNIGGNIDVLSIIFSVMLLLTLQKKRWYKVAALVLNIILQYVCLILTSSRTSLYTLIICLFAFLFLTFASKFKIFSIRTLKGFSLNLIMAFLVAGSLYGISAPVKNAMAYVPGIVNVDLGKLVEKKTEKDEEDKKKIKKDSSKKKIELTRLEVLENRDGGILTGRLYIWKAGLKAWQRSPIFGISKNTIYDYSKEYISDKQWLIPMETSLHNGYITVLVASGIVGFIVYILFLIFNIIPMIKTAFIHMQKENYILFAGCLVVVASFLMIECFEARIVYRTEIFTAMFWLICGLVFNYTEIVKLEDEIDSSNS